MNSNINEMLAKYTITNAEEEKNAVKEIIQEIVLCGLSRSGFFNKAAFYGGTALRIFYGLDRFSEDLDFSLLKKNPDFDLSSYFPTVQKEINSFGLNMEIITKEKTTDSPIKSAFIKGNSKEHILLFNPNSSNINLINKNESIKIKFEVDIDPPENASFETKYQLLPSPYEVQLYDMTSLFAGKIHAVLCRAWKNRIKGRDLYDYIFYLSRNSHVNMEHLKARLIESKVLRDRELFNIDILKEMLCSRFDSIDYSSAKEDVMSFINDKQSLDLWNPDFFKKITNSLS